MALQNMISAGQTQDASPDYDGLMALSHFYHPVDDNFYNQDD